MIKLRGNSAVQFSLRTKDFIICLDCEIVRAEFSTTVHLVGNNTLVFVRFLFSLRRTFMPEKQSFFKPPIEHQKHRNPLDSYLLASMCIVLHHKKGRGQRNENEKRKGN